MASFMLYVFFLLIMANSIVTSDPLSLNIQNVVMKFETQYVNETSLKHLVYISQEGFEYSGNSIQNAISLLLSYNDEGVDKTEPLQVLSSEWSLQNGNILIIYTNNPLNLSEKWSQSSLSLFPTLETLQTSFQTQQIGIQLQISQNLTQTTYPQLRIVGDTIFQFNLTDTSFSASYLKQSSMQQWYLIIPGYLIVLFLIVNYFIRSFYTDHNISSDHGEIIMHYLALASPTLMVNTLTAQLMSFCYGFMLLNFPWMNDRLGSIFGNPFDSTPFQMKVFYTDLGFGSTYCLGFAIVFLLIIVGYIFLSLDSTDQQAKETTKTIYFNYIYNVFLYGTLFSAMLSIQGIVINSANQVLSFKNAASSIFYLIAIIILILIIVDVVHSLFKYQSKHFYKLRAIIKTMFLSLSHLRVNYFIVVMICLDVLFAGAEYLISRKENPKGFNKLWIFKNILLNLALLFLIFLPIKLVAVILAFVFVTILIGVEIYEHYMIYQANKLAHVNQAYRPAYHNTINHTTHTDRHQKKPNLNLINASLQFMQDPNSNLQILPNTGAVMKSNRQKMESKRKYEENDGMNLNPLQHTIQYEPRHRRERRKNSLKNAASVSVPNHKAVINSSNEHILHVRNNQERPNFYED